MHTLEDQHASLAPSTESGQEFGVAKTYRILVADDNAVNVKVGLLQLKQLGYRADAVNDGVEVLAALELGSYDLILMDCHMPRMDGYQATRELRSRHRDRPRIPVIAMTANALLGNRERCLAAGMDDYISKPVNCDALSKLLAKWLNAAVEQRGETLVETAPPSARAAAEKNNPEEDAMLAELAQIGTYIGEESVAEIVGLFVEDAPRRMTTIEEAFRNGDPHALEMTAHALRGSCLYLSLSKMAALCAIIEEFCGRREPVAQSLIGELKEETSRAVESLKDAMARYTSMIKR